MKTKVLCTILFQGLLFDKEHKFSDVLESKNDNKWVFNTQFQKWMEKKVEEVKANHHRFGNVVITFVDTERLPE